MLLEWQIARLHCPTVGTFEEWAVWAETSTYVEACPQVWVCPNVKATVGLYCRPPGGVPHSGIVPLAPWDLKRDSRFKPTGLRETLHTPIELCPAPFLSLVVQPCGEPCDGVWIYASGLWHVPYLEGSDVQLNDLLENIE